LKSRYENDAEFKQCVKMVGALAFVPVDAIEEFYDALCEGIPDDCRVDMQDFCDYFEDNYVGRMSRNNRRRRPLFAHDLW
jgi:hypothetical protein